MRESPGPSGRGGMSDLVPGINRAQCGDLSLGFHSQQHVYFLRTGDTVVKHISQQLGRLLGLTRRVTRVQVKTFTRSF